MFCPRPRRYLRRGHRQRAGEDELCLRTKYCSSFQGMKSNELGLEMKRLAVGFRNCTEWCQTTDQTANQALSQGHSDRDFVRAVRKTASSRDPFRVVRLRDRLPSKGSDIIDVVMVFRCSPGSSVSRTPISNALGPGSC